MKKVLSIFLALLMLCSTGTLAFTSSAASVVASGTSNKVTWSLDSDGKMTLSGNGNMANYSDTNRPPWDSYKSQMKSLVINNGVTSIGNYAFYNYKTLTGALTIPNSVTSIGASAFDGCSGFNGTLSLGNGVTNILTGAFRDCMFTGNLRIPDSVTAMGSCVFQRCKGFKGTLTLGAGLQSIPYATFSGCSGFKGSLTIPDIVTDIQSYAFANCTGLDGTLHIGSSVTKINPLSFYGCSGFKGDLIIPDSVKEIGYGAFACCTGFDGTLVLSKNLETLSEDAANSNPGAFSECENLQGELILPDSLKSIGRNSFSGCYNLSGTLSIPEGVTYMGTDPFHACAKKTDIVQFFANYPEMIQITETVGRLPNCTENGSKSIRITCSGCGAVIDTQYETIPMRHAMFHADRVEPTDKRDGTLAYYNCTVCNKYFLDENGEQEVTANDLAIHYPDTPKQTNAKVETDNRPASFELVTCCKHDGTEISRETVTLEMHPAKEATLEEDGNIKYYTDDAGNQYVYNEESKTFEEADEVATPSLLVKETELVVGSSQIWIPMYNKIQIIAYVLPENATFKEVTFTVEDPSILSVDEDGNLTPLSLGETNVIVSSHHGLTKTIPVVVQHGHVAGEPQYEDVTIEPTCVTPGRGMLIVRCNECGAFMSSTGPVEILPTGIHLTESVAAREATEEADGNIAHYVCSSCNGLFKDEEAKQMTTKEEVTLHFADEPKIENSKPESEDQPASYELVTYCKHDGIELYCKTVTLEMHPAVEASLLGDGNVKYYTDEEGNKYVFDDETGTFKPTDDIEVPFVPIAVEKLNLNETEVTLLIGATFQLEPTVEPADATFPQVIFTSSDEAVAEVNPLGLITAKAEGTATIECVTADGATAAVTVTIQHRHNPGEPKIEDITKEATCCESGVGDLVTRCTICGEELAREKDVTMPATGKHTPDAGTKADEVKGTCETEGSYVFVVKCRDCGEVLSSETISTGYGDHTWNDGEVKSGKYDKYTVTDYTCQHCGRHKTEQTRNPNYQFRCKRCDWYDARRSTPGVRGFIYRMIHDITHMVQRINFLT